MTGTRLRAVGKTATVTLDEIRTTWPPTVSVRTAAPVIGISPSGAYELVRRDEFPCRVLKVGGRYRVVTAELVRLLDADSVGVASPPPRSA